MPEYVKTFFKYPVLSVVQIFKFASDTVFTGADNSRFQSCRYIFGGKFRRQFGTQGSEPGQFHFPLGIATTPDGQICIADSGNHRLQILAPDGRPLGDVPLPDAGSEMPPDPTDAGVDPARRRVYVRDNDNHRVLVYDLANSRFESVWGKPGQGRRQFRYPFLVDLSADGYLLVVESINTRVQMLNPEL